MNYHSNKEKRYGAHITTKGFPIKLGMIISTPIYLFLNPQQFGSLGVLM
jgi:hypothetical protein